MKSIVKIGEHYVVRGMSIDEYARLVGSPGSPTKSIDSIEDLCAFLDEMEEVQGGCDPLWDFPLDEMQDDTIEDNGFFYVELFDDSDIELSGHPTPRYFETLIPNTEIKEVL